MLEYLMMFLLIVVAFFLILLVLLQRGRGGGLAGAFGGMGGQSAFGTKAGDTFTKITVGTAAVWILLCAASVKMLGSADDKLAPDVGKKAVPAAGPEDKMGKAASAASDKDKKDKGDTSEKAADEATTPEKTGSEKTDDGKAGAESTTGKAEAPATETPAKETPGPSDKSDPAPASEKAAGDGK